MPVNEEMRHEVYEEFKRAHGARFAGVIMEMLPPAGVPELATKADLDVLRAEVAAVEARVGERLERAIRQQTNRFIGWMLAAFGLVVTANGLVTALA